ncbi:MAG TPA: hypothetical protein VGL19_16485 [Polyangiaceae bacterium]|jgi:hypothetical protein
MQISPLAQRLLQLVFSLSSASAALTRPRLERRLSLARGALSAPLDELARLGLVDAQRLRLTLSGLALAVACGARSRKNQRPAPRRISEPVSLRAPIALFSEREAPRAVA